MAHDHTYDCPQCGAHLDSQRELDDHTRKQHNEGAQSASGSERGRDNGSGRGGLGNGGMLGSEPDRGSN